MYTCEIISTGKAANTFTSQRSHLPLGLHFLPICPRPQFPPKAPTDLLYYGTSLYLLKFCIKWNLLVSFTSDDVLKAHRVAALCIGTSVLLTASSTPLHQHRCCNLFIHSLADGPLGCFHSRPLKIKLLQIRMHKPLYGCMLSFLLTKTQEGNGWTI